jgi:hypothetical protein
VANEIDLTALVRERLDLNALVSDIDVEAVINRIDVIALADKVIECWGVGATSLDLDQGREQVRNSLQHNSSDQIARQIGDPEERLHGRRDRHDREFSARRRALRHTR